jgi:hypothetical protein
MPEPFTDADVEAVARALHFRDYEGWPEPECTNCMDAARDLLDQLSKRLAATGRVIVQNRGIGLPTLDKLILDYWKRLDDKPQVNHLLPARRD